MATAHAYHGIVDTLANLNVRTFETFVHPPEIGRPATTEQVIDLDHHINEGQSMYASLNHGQMDAVDAIISSLQCTEKRCVFVDCPGRSGKTFLYNTLYL